MEFTGKIIAVLEQRSGVSKTGNNWIVQSYVIEDASSGQYPRRMCFEVFGEEKIKQFDIKNGEDLTVSFDVDARQWQDKWFNSIRVWKVVRNNEAGAQQFTPPTAEVTNFPPAADANSNDDLPF